MTQGEKGGGAVLSALGDGLVLRRASQDDAAALASFNATVFGDFDSGEPDPTAAGWVRDLMRGDHPTFKSDDFLLVEDTEREIIVSSLCLISQTWAYEGIEFGVGRPELVGTHREYRRRGLVRLLMEALHKMSAERGEMVQAILGVPWYYRQFGYDYALEQGGGRAVFRSQVPALAEGAAEPFTLRPATADDRQFVASLYDQAMRRYCVTTVLDDALWRYELTERTHESDVSPIWRIIERDGKAVGALRHGNSTNFGGFVVSFYELAPGVPWHEATPSVLRYVEEVARKMMTGATDLPEYRFSLGSDHPVYHALPNLLATPRRQYAWYMRVPDLVAFLRLITPMLDKRLAESALAGYSGEILVSFFRDGLRLVFEAGKLSQVEAWKPQHIHHGDAVFGNLIFLQLLFGYRSLEDLQHAYPDCRVKKDLTRSVIAALFPHRPSFALGIV